MWVRTCFLRLGNRCRVVRPQLGRHSDRTAHVANDLTDRIEIVGCARATDSSFPSRRDCAVTPRHLSVHIATQRCSNSPRNCSSYRRRRCCCRWYDAAESRHVPHAENSSRRRRRGRQPMPPPAGTYREIALAVSKAGISRVDGTSCVARHFASSYPRSCLERTCAVERPLSTTSFASRDTHTLGWASCAPIPIATHSPKIRQCTAFRVPEACDISDTREMTAYAALLRVCVL